MAQLSDDCFAFGGALLPLEQALALVAAVPPVDGTERVALAQLDGRVLATPLVAPVDLPPFMNSAVDGYAVCLGEADVVTLDGRTQAGAVAASLRTGTARRILTGAPLPAGADTVFMQEDVRLEAGRVHLPPGLKRWANVRPQGEDVTAGTIALPAGRRMRPQDVSLAAALGVTALEVRRRVRVALLSTGDELVEPGTMPGPAHRYDSNRVLIAALLARAGVEVTDLGIVPDQPGAMREALRAGAGHDLVLTTGGVSAGEEDHVRTAIEHAGRLTFWRLAIKPGRPVAMGHVGDAIVMGLPGNPAAAFVTFTVLARPLLDALAGATPVPAFPLHATAAFSYRKKPGRREYVRVLLAWDGGVLRAHRHPVEGAGILTSLTETHGLAVLEDDRVAVATGDELSVFLY